MTRLRESVVQLALAYGSLAGLGACVSESRATRTLVHDGGGLEDAGAKCPVGEEPGTVLWQQTYPPNLSFGYGQLIALHVDGEGLLTSGSMPSGGWLAQLDENARVLWEDSVEPGPAHCYGLPLRNGALFASCRVTVDCSLGSVLQGCDTDGVLRYYEPDHRLKWEDIIDAPDLKGSDDVTNPVELSPGALTVAYSLSTFDVESSVAYLRTYDDTGKVQRDTALTVGGESVSALRFLIQGSAPKTLFASGHLDFSEAVFKLDVTGKVLWVHRREAGALGSFARVAPYGDGVAVVGSAHNDEQGLFGTLEILSGDGKSVLEVSFPGERGNWAGAQAIATTTDGRIFVAMNDQDGQGMSEAYVMEVSPQGKVRWRSPSWGDPSANITSLTVREQPCSLLVAGSEWEELDGGLVTSGLAAELSL